MPGRPVDRHLPHLEHHGRRLTLDEFGGLLQTTAATIVDGDDEDDNVTNTGHAFFRLDLPALADAGVEQRAIIRRHDVRQEALNLAGVETVGLRFGGPFDLPTRLAYGRAVKSFAPDAVLTWMRSEASSVSFE